MCTIAAAALLLSMAAALSPAPSCADLFAALPPDSWLVRWRGPSLETGCDDSWQPLLAPRLEVVLHSRHASDYHVLSRNCYGKKSMYPVSYGELRHCRYGPEWCANGRLDSLTA